MKNKIILIIIFIIYLAALLRITVFRSGFDFSNAFSGGEINLVPFADLVNVFIADNRAFIYLFFGNVLWFVPFGFLMKHITRFSTAKIISMGLFVSLFIEIMQFIFCTGICEADDIILNTLGTFIGTTELFRRARNKNAKTS